MIGNLLRSAVLMFGSAFRRRDLHEGKLEVNAMKAISSKQKSVFEYGFLEDDFVPDRLVQEQGFLIYDEMLENDADVKNAYILKKFALVSPGWEIQPAEVVGGEEKQAEREKAAEVATFVKDILDGMEHSFDGFLVKLLDAFRQGFKVAEKVYRPIETGEHAGKWGIERLLVRNSRWYRFRTDKAGILLDDGLLEIPTNYYDPDAYITSPPPTNSKRLPVQKFIIYTHGATDDSGESIYGRSDYQAPYRHYWSNMQLQKILNSGIEKLFEPFRIIKKVEGGASGGGQDESVLAAMDDLGVRLTALVPKGYEVDIVQAASSGASIGSLVNDAMEKNSSAIARGMLVGDLVQSRGDVGSFALGKMHFTTFLLVIQALARELAFLLNHQLIRPLVDVNFPDAEGFYPSLYFNAANTEDSKVKAEILQIAIDKGMADPREAWVREYIGIPEMDPELALVIEKEDEERKKSEEAAAAAVAQGAGPPGTQPGNDPREPVPGEKPSAGGPAKGNKKELADLGGHLLLRRALLPVEQKIDYIEVAGTLASLETTAIAGLNKAIESVFDSIHAQVRRRRIVEDKKRFEAANVRVDPTNIARAIYASAASKYVQGKVDALKEINKQLRFMGRPPIEDERDYIDSRELAAGIGINLTTEQAAASRAMKISQEELDAFRDRTMALAQAKALKAQGDISSELTSVLLTGIENKLSSDATIALIDERVKKRWLHHADELAAGTGPIIDTLDNAAYNEGRLKLYAQASNHVVALVYSAVLDDRTTDFCRRHDGFIARRDDPVWGSITPPNHFRCRSIIGAVLRGETYDATEKPAVDPASGFERTGFDINLGVN